MAENKKGFVLYADLITVVKKLVIQDRENNTNYAGELFLLILEYVNDMNPVPINFIVELAFEPIKIQLKRDLIKYEEKVTQCSYAGKRSAESRKVKKKQRPLTPVKTRSTNPTVIDSVTVKDTDTVNDSIIHIEKAYEFLKSKNPIEIEAFEINNKKSFAGDFEKFVTHYNYKVILDDVEWDITKLMAKLMIVNNNWDKTGKKQKKEKVSAGELIQKKYNLT